MRPGLLAPGTVDLSLYSLLVLKAGFRGDVDDVGHV